MAKYKSYKTNSKKGIIGVIVAITASLLILGSAAGVMGYGTSGFKDWSFPNFSGKTKVEQVLEDDKEEKNGGAVITENETKGMRLMSSPIPREQYEEYGIMPMTLTAQTITATFTPENTTIKKVEWTVSGGDGKVSVNAIYGNPLQATVSVSGAFGTQAIITCTSQVKTEIKATATVDFVKNIDTDIKTYNDDISSVKTTSSTTCCLPDFTTGTVMPDSIVMRAITVELNGKISNYLKEKGWQQKDSLEFENQDILKDSQIFSIKDFVTNASTENDYERLYSDIAEYTINNNFNEYFYTMFNDDGSDAIKIYYKGIEYYSLDIQCTVDITVTSFDDLEVLPRNLQFNTNSLVFGG